MRRFYLLWAPFCSIWGYLFATFPTSTVERMTGKVAGLFLWSLALSFALPSARNDLGQFILALSGGGFVGALLASAVYRRAKRARS
jgi:predicted membrane protein